MIFFFHLSSCRVFQSRLLDIIISHFSFSFIKKYLDTLDRNSSVPNSSKCSNLLALEDDSKFQAVSQLVSIMAHGISQEKMDEIGLDAEQVNGWFIQSSKLTPGR